MSRTIKVATSCLGLTALEADLKGSVGDCPSKMLLKVGSNKI